MTEDDGRKVVARNRKARHEYDILETFEAGMVLKGRGEVLRDGKVSFRTPSPGWSGARCGSSLHISPYEQANRFNVDPLRARKLLLNRDEIRRLVGKVEEKGLTLVPLEIYFRRGYAKVTPGPGPGKEAPRQAGGAEAAQQEREARRAMGRRRGEASVPPSGSSCALRRWLLAASAPGRLGAATLRGPARRRPEANWCTLSW